LRKSWRRAPGPPQQRRLRVNGQWAKVPVFRREQLSKALRRGPALVIDYGATTLIPPGWKFFLDEVGNLVLRQ